MNRNLLAIIACAACAAQASGAIVAPKLYQDASFQAISDNGRFAVSCLMGTLTIYDLQEGTEKMFADEAMYFDLGLGRPITADGSIIVGSTEENSNASYYNGEEWIRLNVPDQSKTNLSNAVTPDGKRICGSVGTHGMSIAVDALMQAPAYWDRQEDGTYGECQILPFPTTDFFGATPQYVTATDISDNGMVIVGQVVDCSGSMAVPIVYTQGDNGEWTYSFPTRDLFNPDGIAPVENPGDSPTMPNEENFMTEQEKADRDAAYQQWMDEGCPEGLFPEYTDYMTEEEKEAFNTAYKECETKQLEWQTKYDEYNAYFWSVLDSSPTFVFNTSCISADGKTIAISAQISVEDPGSWWPVTHYHPWVIEIASGETTKYESSGSLIPRCITADGTVLAGSPYGTIPMTGYVLKEGTATPLLDYISTVSPEYGEWFTKNMTHEIAVREEWNEDLQDYEVIYEEITFTGMPIATPDLKVMAIWNDCPWDMASYAQGVIIDFSADAAISTVTADKGAKPCLDADGNLVVASDAVSVAVYNIAGALVTSVRNPAGPIALGIAPGAYIVKVVNADGTADTAKITM